MHIQSLTIFNLRSPSSKREVVAAIVHEFLRDPSALALDVGGTNCGFRNHLPGYPFRQRRDLFNRIRIVNPKGWRRYANRIEDVPSEDRYELIMIFGTIMYMSSAELDGVLVKARELLRDEGTLLVADPDGSTDPNKRELKLRKGINRFLAWSKRIPVLGRLLRCRPLPEHIYGTEDVRKKLLSAGFQVRSRSDLEGRKSSLAYFVLEGRKPRVDVGSPDVGIAAPVTAVTRRDFVELMANSRGGDA